MSDTRPKIMGERMMVTVTYRVIGGDTFTVLEDDEGNSYLKLETFDLTKALEPNWMSGGEL
jgi:hypothetical protein